MPAQQGSGTTGTSETAPHGHTLTPSDLLMEKVVVDESTGCWIFTGTLVKGYGAIYLGRKARPMSVYAHRVSYEYHVGPIPDGLVIDHLCQNKACVNPAHLDACEQRENMRRESERRTHCRSGRHVWVDENIVLLYGVRHCRICRDERLAVSS